MCDCGLVGSIIKLQHFYQTKLHLTGKLEEETRDVRRLPACGEQSDAQISRLMTCSRAKNFLPRLCLESPKTPRFYHSSRSFTGCIMRCRCCFASVPCRVQPMETYRLLSVIVVVTSLLTSTGERPVGMKDPSANGV